MKILQGWDKARREKERARKARRRAAKEAMRLRDTAGLPAREPLAGKLVWTLTVHNQLTGALETWDLRVSPRRVNSFALAVDGRPLYRRISASQIAARLRERIAPRWLSL